MNKASKATATMIAVMTSTVVLVPTLDYGAKTENVKLLVDRSNKVKTQGQIDINNVWSQSLFNITINNGALQITKGWSEVNPYAGKGTLDFVIEQPDGTILKKLSFNAGDYPENTAFKELNGYNLQVGSLIKITSNTGSKYVIDNNSESKTVLYEYTGNRLKEITKSATDVQALNNGENHTEVSCKVEPNTKVTFINNDEKITETSNSKGLITVKMKANIGDKITIEPYNELESTVTVKANPISYIIQAQRISIENVWKYGIATIGFNYNNTLKVTNEGAITNPYYKGDDAMTVSLLNNVGGVISSQKFKGGLSAGGALSKVLNGKPFNYGDSIEIISNSGENIVQGDKSYKGNILFKLTKNGIVAESFNNKSFNASYGINGTVVSGETTPNTTVIVTANNKEYTTSSNSQGKFTCNIGKEIKPGKLIYINENGNTYPETVTLNTTDFKISNYNIKVYNNWGSLAQTINFNPGNMKINASGYNAYLGAENPGNAVQMEIYRPGNGQLVAGGMFKGEENTSTFNKAFNGKLFNYGDVISVCYNPSQAKVTVNDNNTSVGYKSQYIQYYEITSDGLKPYTNQLTVNPLNVLTKSSTNSFTLTGSAVPNSTVTASCNGQKFTTTAESNGKYDLNINTKEPLTLESPIVVSSSNAVPVVTYLSYESNLQSTSGLYIAQRNAGKNLGELTFNPVTMKTQWEDYGTFNGVNPKNPTVYSKNSRTSTNNTLLGGKNSEKVFSISIEDSEGKIILNKSFNGNNTVAQLINSINNISYNFGDKVTIYAKAGILRINACNDGKIATPNNETKSVIITKNGLIDADKGQNLYSAPFNISDYYAQKGIVSTGITASGWDASSKGQAESIVMNQAMKDAVNNAIKGCTTDYEKAKAIYNLVSPIPYISAGGNTINTWEHGGVCYNKAMLYVAMCQYAGLCTRVVTGYVNEPGPYETYGGYHSWNEVWLQGQNRWATVDTTWHMFDCKEYVDSSRHSFSVQITAWNPNKSYESYFINDPAMAWYHTGEVWNGALYYNFNLGSNPAFRNLFNDIYPSNIEIVNGWGSNAADIGLNEENHTFTVSGSNQYLGGYTSNHFMNISLIDGTTDKVISTFNANGNTPTSSLNKYLNGKPYKVGDILEFKYNTSQGNLVVSNNKKQINKSKDGNVQYIKITENGFKVVNSVGQVKVTKKIDNKILESNPEIKVNKSSSKKEDKVVSNSSDKSNLKNIKVQNSSISNAQSQKLQSDVKQYISNLPSSIGNDIINQLKKIFGWF